MCESTIVKRRPGELLPIEVDILVGAATLLARGSDEFHGFLLAKELKGKGGSRLLTAYGTLYRALERMEEAGLLTSRWEEPEIAAREDRPRRHLYRITAAGQKALADAWRSRTVQPTSAPSPQALT